MRRSGKKWEGPCARHALDTEKSAFVLIFENETSKPRSTDRTRTTFHLKQLPPKFNIGSWFLRPRHQAVNGWSGEMGKGGDRPVAVPSPGQGTEGSAQVWLLRPEQGSSESEEGRGGQALRREHQKQEQDREALADGRGPLWVPSLESVR